MTQRVDVINPFNTTNLIFNEIEIDVASPSIGQTLTTISNTSAQWQNQAFGAPVNSDYLTLSNSMDLFQERVINFSREFDIVDNGPFSTYQVGLSHLGTGGTSNVATITINNSSNTAKGRLVADGSTNLVRNDPPYLYVRVRTLGNLSVMPKQGDTVDGVVLNINDLYLLTSAVGQQNAVGIYQTTSIGGNLFQALDSSFCGKYIYVSEGTEGANSIYVASVINNYLCLEGLSRGFNLNNINDLPSTTISGNSNKLYFLGGSFPTATTLTVTSDNSTLEGQTSSETELQIQGSSDIVDLQGNNMSLKELRFSSTIVNNNPLIAFVGTGLFLEKSIFPTDGRPSLEIGSGSQNLMVLDSYLNSSISLPGDPALDLINSSGIIDQINVSNNQILRNMINLNMSYSYAIKGVLLNQNRSKNAQIKTKSDSMYWNLTNNLFTDDFNLNFDGSQLLVISGNLAVGTSNQDIVFESANPLNSNVKNNLLRNGSRMTLTNITSASVSDNLFDGTTASQMINISGTTSYLTVNGNHLIASHLFAGISSTSTAPQISVQKNNIVISTTNPISLNGYNDKYLITESAGLFSTVLNDLTLNSTGHYLYLEAVSTTVSPAFNVSFTGSGGLTDIEFTGTGSYIWLCWTGTTWSPQGQSNVVIT